MAAPGRLVRNLPDSLPKRFGQRILPVGFHRRIRGSVGLIGNNTGHRFQGLL